MPYNLYNGSANIVSNIIASHRKTKKLSYAKLSDKLQLKGISLYKSDLFLIEHNQRFVRDFELVALCNVLDIDYETEIKNIIE